jgi:hypothetical protein
LAATHTAAEPERREHLHNLLHKLRLLPLAGLSWCRGLLPSWELGTAATACSRGPWRPRCLRGLLWLHRLHELRQE